MKNILKSCKKYFLEKNPVFVSLVSICPTLTSTTSINTAFYMSICITFVLVMSEVVVSACRKIVPKPIISHFAILVTSTFVTVIYLLTRAFFPMYYNLLSLVLPLLVVNCLIRSKVRTFAVNEDVIRSFLDGLISSISISVTIILIAFFREFFSSGSVLISNYYFTIVPRGTFPTFFGENAGAFLSIAIIAFILNILNKKSEFLEQDLDEFLE